MFMIIKYNGEICGKLSQISPWRMQEQTQQGGPRAALLCLRAGKN
jgi:hypothetical protein